MDDEVERLRARVAELEAEVAKALSTAELALENADRLDVALACSRSLEEHVIVPLLLRLAGFGHRQEMDEMLAALELDIQANEPVPQLDLDRRRVAYWRKQIQKMPKWHGFPPTAFYDAGWEED